MGWFTTSKLICCDIPSRYYTNYFLVLWSFLALRFFNLFGHLDLAHWTSSLTEGSMFNCFRLSIYVLLNDLVFPSSLFFSNFEIKIRKNILSLTRRNQTKIIKILKIFSHGFQRFLNFSWLVEFSILFSIVNLVRVLIIIICFGKMTTLRQFTCDDMFRFNPINLDPLTETYGVGFYLQYLARWPEYFLVAEAPSGDLMGYIMGKAEGTFCSFLISTSRFRDLQPIFALFENGRPCQSLYGALLTH